MGFYEAEFERLRENRLRKDFPEAEFIDDDEQEKEKEQEEISEDIVDLLYIGHLRERFDLFGHSFQMRTLTIGEELIVGQLAKEFSGDPIAYTKASMTAYVAASLEEVDGEAPAVSLGPNQNPIPVIYQKIRNEWHFPVIDRLYQKYESLRERADEAVKSLEKKFKTSLS